MKTKQVIDKSFYNKLQTAATQEINGQKIWWKSTMPYLLCASACWFLSEQALIKPSEVVAWGASKVLAAGTAALVVKAAFNFYHQMDKEYANLDKKKLCM